MPYTKEKLASTLVTILGEQQVDALGLPKATAEAALKLYLHLDCHSDQALVVREALTHLSDDGAFQYDGEEDLSRPFELNLNGREFKFANFHELTRSWNSVTNECGWQGTGGDWRDYYRVILSLYRGAIARKTLFPLSWFEYISPTISVKLLAESGQKSDSKQIATFRTECENDGDRVTALLKELGFSIERKSISECAPGYNVCLFSILIEAGVTLNQINLRMEFMIRNDPRFVDLNRCYETLQVGDTPKG